MGKAFSKGTVDHLPPMRLSDEFFTTETQADVLRHEVTVSETDYDSDMWQAGTESQEGLRRIEVPVDGRQVEIQVVGHAKMFVDARGLVMLDTRVLE